MTFRKYSVALQLRWDTWEEMCDHAGVGPIEDGKPMGCFPYNDSNTIGLMIPRANGVEIAVQGDWIIRGSKGELSVRKV